MFKGSFMLFKNDYFLSNNTNRRSLFPQIKFLNHFFHGKTIIRRRVSIEDLLRKGDEKKLDRHIVIKCSRCIVM